MRTFCLPFPLGVCPNLWLGGYLFECLFAVSCSVSRVGAPRSPAQHLNGAPLGNKTPLSARKMNTKYHSRLNHVLNKFSQATAHVNNLMLHHACDHVCNIIASVFFVDAHSPRDHEFTGYCPCVHMKEDCRSLVG